jgi:predicted dehydrogenase
MSLAAKVRYGMVGGGPGAFIGAVHRHAANLDGEIELVCGAFSSHPDKSTAFGQALGLQADRAYPDCLQMLSAEAALPPEQRMQFIAVVTPNNAHYAIASAALGYGFHVLCDKPATLDLAECIALSVQFETAGRLYGLTHPYTAYPMIAEARHRVASGQLGKIRKVLVEYTQGWLTEPVERGANAQARWRTNPAKAGASCTMGDVGVHAFNLAEHVSGLAVTELCAALNRVVPGRVLDDDGAVLLKFDNDATGSLLASQVCVGDENNLRLRIYGDVASLDWQQQEPNSLLIKYGDRPSELLRTGMSYLCQDAQSLTRVPAGHPEGYIEAFANLYRIFAGQIRAFESGTRAAAEVPGIRHALRGMAFIDSVVQASDSDRKWHAFPEC